MNRLLLFVMLLVGLTGTQTAVAQTGDAGLPPRPTPFKFVNDQASLMAPADARKLDSGLRRYADNTGTQIVVVTVPSLGGRPVADYARALGTAWGVGQRDKNNGIVLLLSAQEHKVTIQPGRGLQSAITPEVTSRVINEMTPDFKQNNYFAGLRAGLNTLMATANPSSVKGATATTTAAAAATGTPGTIATTKNPSDNLSAENQPYPATSTTPVTTTPVEPVSSGPGIGTLLIGALVIGGILWFVVRMFRGRSAAANNQVSTPNFLPNRPADPVGGNYGPGYGNVPNQSSGPGIGGMLATGAVAAAGAYLGNRMASGHETAGNSMTNDSNTGLGGAGVAGAAASSAGSDYFKSREGNGTANPAPDYFSDANTAPDKSNDFFSTDDNNSSYDDNSSGDTGGGSFDETSDNSGSW